MIRVITGHICSGKSRYVTEHAAERDIVIDMDRIALAISAEGTRHHEYGDDARDIARAIRWHAIDAAVRSHKAGRFDLWIIHAYPTAADMATYRRLGAAVRHMECDDQTLLARASQERPAAMLVLLRSRLVAGGGMD